MLLAYQSEIRDAMFSLFYFISFLTYLSMKDVKVTAGVWVHLQINYKSLKHTIEIFEEGVLLAKHYNITLAVPEQAQTVEMLIGNQFQYEMVGSNSLSPCIYGSLDSSLVGETSAVYLWERPLNRQEVDLVHAQQVTRVSTYGLLFRWPEVVKSLPSSNFVTTENFTANSFFFPEQ